MRGYLLAIKPTNFLKITNPMRTLHRCDNLCSHSHVHKYTKYCFLAAPAEGNVVVPIIYKVNYTSKRWFEIISAGFLKHQTVYASSPPTAKATQLRPSCPSPAGVVRLNFSKPKSSDLLPSYHGGSEAWNLESGWKGWYVPLKKKRCKVYFGWKMMEDACCRGYVLTMLWLTLIIISHFRWLFDMILYVYFDRIWRLGSSKVHGVHIPSETPFFPHFEARKVPVWQKNMAMENRHFQ